MSHPVADYLHELSFISGVSVPESSGYSALSKLINAVVGYSENIQVIQSRRTYYSLQVDSGLLKRLVTVC